MPATKITVNHNGSIRIEGEFEIFDPEGKPFGWLAGRLSASAAADTPPTSPSATASHKTCGFIDSVAARELPPPSRRFSASISPSSAVSNCETVSD